MKSDREQEDVVDFLHKKARGLLQQHIAKDSVVAELVREGISSEYAEVIISNVLNDRTDQKSFWKLIVGGLFFIFGGVALNVFSFQIAANSGSFFFLLFWGIVVTGIIMIIRAFILFKK